MCPDKYASWKDPVARGLSMFNPAPKHEKEAIIQGKIITLAGKEYDLIMCYICPICQEPIVAYWKLNGAEPVTGDVVGRTLRDSGFGGYAFFETKGGQGFEYDHLRDPRKRHGHQITEKATYSYNDDKTTQLWMPFISLNPVFSLNDYFGRCLNPHDNAYEKGHLFVELQSTALEIVQSMREHADVFKVVDDKLKHGKPLFYFNLVTWDELTKEYTPRYASRHYVPNQDVMHKKRIDALRAWFGNKLDLVKYLRFKDTQQEEPEEGGGRYGRRRA